MDCVFCKIMNGEIPSYTLYEDEIVKVFLDINPDSNGHTLIVPKKHTLDITTIDDETLKHIKDVSLEIKKMLEEKLKCDGVTYIQNNGIKEFVKHFHLHLIPAYQDKQEIKSVEEIYEKLKNA